MNKIDDRVHLFVMNRKKSFKSRILSTILLTKKSEFYIILTVGISFIIYLNEQQFCRKLKHFPYLIHHFSFMVEHRMHIPI